MVKSPSANAGDSRDAGWIPGLGRSPGAGTGNPLQYSCLGNPMERGAWRAIVHEVTKSWIQLSTHTSPCLARTASHPPVRPEPLARKAWSGMWGRPGRLRAWPSWDWWAGAWPALGPQRQPRDACVSRTGPLPKVLCCSHTGHQTPALRADVVPAQPSPMTLGGRLLSAWWGERRRKT